MEQTERALCRLAKSQCGMFSAAQAARLGISHAQLSRAAAKGIFAGLGRAFTLSVRSQAAIGSPSWPPPWPSAPDAVISHAAAAAFTASTVTVAPTYPELTCRGSPPLVCQGWSSTVAGLFRHRTSSVKYGVQVTSAARTLVDLAGRYKLSTFERILDETLINVAWA